MKRFFLGLLALGLIALTLFFLYTSWIIGQHVASACKEAQVDYGTGCVDALVETVRDESNSFAARNHAIWALGQIGDQRATDALLSLYTGDIPAREPYNETLSQYELKKALNLIDSGLNLTHLVWSPAKLIN